MFDAISFRWIQNVWFLVSLNKRICTDIISEIYMLIKNESTNGKDKSLFHNLEVSFDFLGCFIKNKHKVLLSIEF